MRGASPSSETISKSEYARRRGCAPSAITRAIKEGRITVVDGRIDPVQADAQWAERSRSRADSRPAAAAPAAPAPEAPAPPPQSASDYQTFRARRERAEAEKAEIAAARDAGRLIDREMAEKVGFEAFRTLRDALFAATKSQSRRVIGLTELRDIEIALEDELREVLAGWDERIAKLELG